MKNEIYKQLRSITLILIDRGICVNQNFPERKGDEILWEGYKNLSFTLKDRPYIEICDTIIANRDYNLLLFDGAIIQMKYKFHNQNLIEHVLLYYPNADSEKFIDAPKDYEENNYGTKLFTDMVVNNWIVFPIRFDYTNTIFTECDHPYSHATLGNYIDCRVPVSSPISPFKFIHFILRSFYFPKLQELFTNDELDCNIRFDKTITKKEESLIHFNCSTHLQKGKNLE